MGEVKIQYTTISEELTDAASLHLTTCYETASDDDQLWISTQSSTIWNGPLSFDLDVIMAERDPQEGTIGIWIIANHGERQLVTVLQSKHNGVLHLTLVGVSSIVLQQFQIER